MSEPYDYRPAVAAVVALAEKLAREDTEQSRMDGESGDGDRLTDAESYAIIPHMDKHRFTLILPLDLWSCIRALARHNRRAATQEIILAIEEHLRGATTHDQDNSAHPGQGDIGKR